MSPEKVTRYSFPLWVFVSSNRSDLHLILFSLLILFFSCERKEDKLSKDAVTYIVTETSSATPVYAVEYTAENGITKTEGGIREEKWSQTVKGLKSGTFISFTLESTSANGNFKVSIYKDGILLLEDNMEGQYSPLTWNGTIP